MVAEGKTRENKLGSKFELPGNVLLYVHNETQLPGHRWDYGWDEIVSKVKEKLQSSIVVFCERKAEYVRAKQHHEG